MLATDCTQQTAKAPLPVTPAAERADAPVVRRPLPEPPSAASPGTAYAAPSPTEPPAIGWPPDALYVCITHISGQQQQQTAIEFEPKVAKLCAKHPEMGPCQYERDACRRSGGRVFAAGGQEITAAVEAEYDKKIMRIKLKSN